MYNIIVPLVFLVIVIIRIVYKEKTRGLSSDCLSFKNREIDINSLKKYDETFLAAFYQNLSHIGMRTSPITYHLTMYYNDAYQYVRGSTIGDYMKYIVQYEHFERDVTVKRAYTWFYIDSFLRTTDSQPVLNYADFRKGLLLLGFKPFVDSFEELHDIIYEGAYTNMPHAAIRYLVDNYQNGSLFTKQPK